MNFWINYFPGQLLIATSALMGITIKCDQPFQKSLSVKVFSHGPLDNYKFHLYSMYSILVKFQVAYSEHHEIYESA